MASTSRSQKTIVELATQLLSDLDAMAHRDRVALQIEELSRARSKLDRLVRDLEEEVVLFSAAREAGVQFNADRFSEFLVRAKRLAVAESVSKDQIDDLEYDVARALGDERVQIHAGWRQILIDRVPAADGLPELLSAFEDVEGAEDLVGRLRGVVRGIRRIRKAEPSAESLAEIEGYAAEVPEILQALLGEDPGVSEFVKEIAEGGASINSLTPSVLNWIHNRGYERSFKIVAGRPKED